MTSAASPPPPGDSSAHGDFEIFGFPRSTTSGGPRDSQDPLDVAVTEFLEAIRAGKHPAVDEFAGRFPKRFHEVRELLTVAAAMESWKTGREQASAMQSLPDIGKFPDIGGCRLIRELGRGGMGVVYEGVVLASGRRVAVKLMSWRYSSEAVRKRFQNEARVTARLRHPNIVPVFGFGEEQGWCYYIMQLVEGLPLDRVIDILKTPIGAVSAEEIRRSFHSEGGAASKPAAAAASNSPRVLTRNAWPAIAKIGIQAASALGYAHEQAVLHRDIKPANLLLDHAGTVFIADFGVAIDWDAQLQRQRLQLAGTLAYVAPEQLDGHADERSDLYSLGTTLYELCTLQPAYRAESNAELLDLVRKASPLRPRALAPAIPLELERIILKAMAKVPGQRYRSAAELKTALVGFVKESRG